MLTKLAYPYIQKTTIFRGIYYLFSMLTLTKKRF